MPESESKKNVEEKTPPLPFLPKMPASPSHDPDISKADKDARIAWANSFKDCFEANRKMFVTILKGFMKPFWLSIGMNVAVFVVGIIGFSSAMVLSLINGEYLFSLVFGGIDAVTFLAFFLSNPIKNLERDMGFIAWLGLIYNTYWTRAYYATDPNTFQDDLQDITDDAVKSLQKLLATHKKLGELDFLKPDENQQSTDDNKKPKKPEEK